jgi:outer membrane protein assembly factor BamA
MVGIAGNVAFFTGEPQTTRISSVVASLTYSTKQQTALFGRFTLFTAEDGWRVEGDNRAQWTSQDTFGLGTSSGSDSGVNARFNFFRVHETAFRRLRPGLFAGLGLHFDHHSSIRPGDEVTDDQWDNGAFLEYSRTYGLPADRQVSAGLSADAVVDTRDSTIDPRRGWFAAASYRGLIKGFLGGSSEWQLLHIEGRTYAPLAANEQQRLAVWVFGDFVLGGVAPYFDLPSTGMDTYGRSARGYAEGRFRGERLLYGEAEFRRTLTDNGLVGLVAFLNVTTVTNRQTGEQLFETAALGGGAGVRVLLNKRSRTNLCVDFGVGEGSRGVYLAVQEAF